MSLTDHTTITPADLSGPMNELEFLERLESSYEVTTKFVERHKSIRTSNPLSHTDSGWIIATPGRHGILLYDSVKSPEKYIASMNLTTAWVCGRHVGSNYWFRTGIRKAWYDFKGRPVWAICINIGLITTSILTILRYLTDRLTEKSKKTKK